VALDAITNFKGLNGSSWLPLGVDFPVNPLGEVDVNCPVVKAKTSIIMHQYSNINILLAA